MNIKTFFLIFIVFAVSVKADFYVIKNRRGKKIKVKVIKDVNKSNLVDIKDYIPDAVVDLKYAKRSKLSSRRLYKKNICLVNKYLAYKLRKIDKVLRRKYKKKLKFWDCYRPWSIHARKWRRFHNKKYVEPLYKLPKHSRGLSVDVTLVDLNNKEIKMPTKYDYFSKKSYHKYKRLSKKVKNNRRLLKRIMTRYGLSYSPYKWWHYSLRTKRRYPILDFSISEYANKLEKLKRERMFKKNHKKNSDISKIAFNDKENKNRNINKEIKNALDKIKSEIVNCFIAENSRGNTLPEKVDITYVVRQNGKFYDIEIRHPKYRNKKDELNYCILKAFDKISIKRISSPRVGKIPLEFSFE